MSKKKKQRVGFVADGFSKILEGLMRFTTVPLEKSAIKWRMNMVFSQPSFKTEYKGKAYAFDGRHCLFCGWRCLTACQN